MGTIKYFVCFKSSDRKIELSKEEYEALSRKGARNPRGTTREEWESGKAYAIAKET